MYQFVYFEISKAKKKVGVADYSLRILVQPISKDEHPSIRIYVSPMNYCSNGTTQTMMPAINSCTT